MAIFDPKYFLCMGIFEFIYYAMLDVCKSEANFDF